MQRRQGSVHGTADNAWMAEKAAATPSRLAPQSPRRAQGAGAAGLRCDGLAALARLQARAAHAPRHLRTGHRRAGPALQRVPSAPLHAVGARLQRAARAARSHAHSAPTSIARSPPSSPRWRRSPPRGAGHDGLPRLLRAGQGGTEIAPLERRAHRHQPPQLVNTRLALGRAAARQQSRPSPTCRASRGRPASPTCRISSRAPSPSADLLGERARARRARQFHMRWSCRSSRSG